MQIRFLALALLLCPAVIAQINPETGSFFLRSFSSKTYAAQTQNWAAVQDRRGVMYFGNNDGVLEYDGQTWRKILLPNASVVRSLAIDDDGTIYVGGQSELGFLAPDKTGTLQYVSLLPYVNPADRVFSDVWTIFNTRSGIIFSSYSRIFRWSPRQKNMQVWKPASQFGIAFAADNVLYVVEDGSGLLRLVNDSLEPMPGGQQFTRSLRGVARYRGSLLIATANSLHVQNGDHFEKFQTEAESLLRENRITACLPLPDGTLALGTEHHGLVLLDSRGHLLRAVTRNSGLPGNSINRLYADHEGGLWLAMNSGLARVDVNHPVTHFTGYEGLDEITLSICRFGQIYVGTMAGLSRLVTRPGEFPTFELVPNVHGQAAALLPLNERLLVGTSTGAYALTKTGTPNQLTRGAINALAKSASNSSIVYAAGRHGLYVFQSQASGWQTREQLHAVNQDFLSVAEDADGHVWTSTREQIWRFTPGSDQVQPEKFTSADGVPEGENRAYRIRNAVVFGTTKGLLRFDSQERRFVPDFSLGTIFGDGSHPISVIRQAPNGDLWISGKGYLGVLRREKSGYKWDPNVLTSSGINEATDVFFDAYSTIWAAGADGGLIRVQSVPTLLRGSPIARPLLRLVQVAGSKQPLFGGAGGATSSLRLPHRENTLDFEYTVPTFGETAQRAFRVRLDGLSRAWSDWTAEPRKEYTDLWEGKYVFHVQARDARGRISPETSFAFRVLPPFYRQWWAYLLYLVCFYLIVRLIVRWRLSAVEAQNRKLEEIIDARTEEIRNQHDEIRAQRDELKAKDEQTQSLLLNILPVGIAEELRTTGAVQPMSCDNITVCFTDFVGFTLSSEKMPACDLVAALDRYFSEFDRIVDRYGLEKLKTIGDAYMFVGGLPHCGAAPYSERNGQQPDDARHAANAVCAALEIVQVVQRLSASPPGWQIRVGLHTGPVVAGVVGFRKFAFDIWGETVNFASRHEATAPPNCVNISAQTYELVREAFHCEPRGPVRIKEGRHLDMYLAHCVRDHKSGLKISSGPGTANSASL